MHDFDRIGIVGLGYVGQTLTAFLADQGFDVLGLDVDETVVDELDRGEVSIEESGVPERIAKAHAEGRVGATTDYEDLADRDAILVTVGTPLDDDNRPDQSAVESVASSLGPVLPEDALVVLKSTITPGTTEEVLAATIEEETGKVAGGDYHLCFSPERLAEGTALRDLATIPVIVGGVTDACRERGRALFEQVGLETHPVDSPREAEMAKLACNVWIDLNIALANELALVAEQEGIDVFRVIAAANTLPKGDHNVNVLYPGAGVGGSCLPKDPLFLDALAGDHGVEIELPTTSRRVNDRMPHHMRDLAEAALGDLDGRRVAVLGLAFKGGTDDLRHTPAGPLIDALQASGAEVVGHDPIVSQEAARETLGVENLPFEDAISGADALAIVSVHEPFRSIDWSGVAGAMADPGVVVDGRNLLDAETADRAGLQRIAVGVGRDQA